MELRKEKRSYTYADYLAWDDGGRWEIIEGQPYLMSPAPTTAHQRILFNIAVKLGNLLDRKPCEAFIAPFDVRFEAREDTNTIVQPDIVVICDKSKIKKEGCVGAPDVVFEILSPSTAQRDLLKKYNLYEKHGVKEYWVVSPEDKTLVCFSLKNGRYDRAFIEEGSLQSLALPGFALDAQELFASLDDIAQD